jgi:hypothetical protein
MGPMSLASGFTALSQPACPFGQEDAGEKRGDGEDFKLVASGLSKSRRNHTGPVTIILSMGLSRPPICPSLAFRSLERLALGPPASGASRTDLFQINAAGAGRYS